MSNVVKRKLNSFRLSINGSVISSSFASDGCRGKVHYIEHVEVRMRFQSIKRGTLQIYLEAPSGLVSPILTTRQWDMYERLPLNWTFMSVHHWGENPDGEWEIRMETTDPTLSKLPNTILILMLSYFFSFFFTLLKHRSAYIVKTF